MTKQKWYAKSTSASGEPILFREHEMGVTDLAGEYARPLGLERRVRAGGMVHDFGKLSEKMRQVFCGKAVKIDHAGPGGALLYFGNEKKAYAIRDIIEMVVCHHMGRRPFCELKGYLKDICNGDPMTKSLTGQTPSLCGKEELTAACQVFLEEIPEFKTAMQNLEPLVESEYEWETNFLFMLQTGFETSCLCDADHSNSAYLESGDPKDIAGTPKLNVEVCLVRLVDLRSRIKANSRADVRVNQMREYVYQACINAAKTRATFLTLTAPTGSAKTFGMLIFAFTRMLSDPSIKRIILVLPFLSLTTQTAEIIREIYPNVLVDTSLEYDPDAPSDLSQRWNVPIIITTSVQFFGSIFSDRPTSLRKVHRTAESIIMIDEVQTIPKSLSRYSMSALRHISENYGSTVVLSSATQPSYAKLPELNLHTSEIIPDVKGLFNMVPRTKLQFEFEPVSLSSIAHRGMEYQNCCVITNKKKHALQVYNTWKEAGLEHVYLLSTALCPDARKKVIAEIKECQENDIPVYVAATQCIEAGVDLDFEKVFRALAPLASLIQAAGRQNRNNRYAQGYTTVFVPLSENGESIYPGAEYEWEANKVKVLIDRGVDVNTLEGMDAYYEELFRDEPETDNLKKAVATCDYQLFARESKLIQDDGYQVIVNYNNSPIYREVLAAVRAGKVTKKHIAWSIGISVQSYDKKAIMEHCEELLIQNRKTGAMHHTGVWILLKGHENCYTEETGLQFISMDDMSIR